MLAMTGKIVGNVQLTMLAAVMAKKRWPSLFLGSCIVKWLHLATSSISAVWLKMSVKAKLNFEVSCLDNGYGSFSGKGKQLNFELRM